MPASRRAELFVTHYIVTEAKLLMLYTSGRHQEVFHITRTSLLTRQRHEAETGQGFID